MVVVPIILSNQEILNNEGEAQLMDVLDSYMAAAERSLEDTMDQGIYSDGPLTPASSSPASPQRCRSRQHRHLRRHRSRAKRLVANQDLRRQLDGDGDRHASQLHHDPADAQLRHDQAVARSRPRRSAGHVAGALCGIRRGDHRDPTPNQRSGLGKLGFSRSNISAAASGRDRARRRHWLEHGGEHHVRAEHR